MTDLEMTRLCLEATGWKYLGAAGVSLTKEECGQGPSIMSRKYPGKLWCLSGGNDWWKDPDGFNICACCQAIPDPLTDDAQAMALVKRFRLWEWIRDGSLDIGDDLNRAIVACVAQMQANRPKGE